MMAGAVPKWAHMAFCPVRHSPKIFPTFKADESIGSKESFWLWGELSGAQNYSFHKGGTGTMGMAESDAPFTAGDDDEHNSEMLDDVSRHRFKICGPQVLHL